MEWICLGIVALIFLGGVGGGLLLAADFLRELWHGYAELYRQAARSPRFGLLTIFAILTMFSIAAAIGSAMATELPLPRWLIIVFSLGMGLAAVCIAALLVEEARETLFNKSSSSNDSPSSTSPAAVMETAVERKSAPMKTFRCYLVEKQASGEFKASIAERPLDALPEGDVQVEVAWSSLNYKDALSATGNPGVTRKFPHVPGIDAAGTVVESRSEKFQAGQAVLVTSYDLGQNHWGGFAEFVRVPAGWVVPLPAGLSLRESMILGTAGFTAALSLEALEQHGISPEQGDIVVTGATGGVGSLAVALLAKNGYSVTAVTGKPSATAFLLETLGAKRVVSREEVDDRSGKPLLSARWAGAIDTVGGNTLATLVRSTQRGGCVAACGLVGGVDLPLSVLPFILRGVTLAGIDSAECPYPKRVEIWNKLAGPWKLSLLDTLSEEVNLTGLSGKIDQILGGQILGRVLVKPTKE